MSAIFKMIANLEKQRRQRRTAGCSMRIREVECSPFDDGIEIFAYTDSDAPTGGGLPLYSSIGVADIGDLKVDELAMIVKVALNFSAGLND